MELVGRLSQKFVLMHVSGIPVRADVRWLAVLLVISGVIAGGIAPITGNLAVSFVLGLSATLVFFVSIFIHEFSHAAVARMEGLRVVEIVLHPFGGLTRFASEPDSPRAEFRVAIAGPAASFVLAVVFGAAAAAADAAELNVLSRLLLTLAIGNLLVAAFNMFPGYPLDGGRVLRAYLWRSGRNLTEATVLTGRSGQWIAAALIALGILLVIARQDLFTGLWAVIVGIFLYDAAGSIIREMNSASQVRVQDVMKLPLAVEPERTIHEVVENILPMNRQPVLPVAREKQLFGMLLLAEIRELDPKAWHATTVRDVMRPVTAEHFVDLETTLIEAREAVRRNGLGAVCIVNAEGKLVGIFRG